MQSLNPILLIGKTLASLTGAEAGSERVKLTLSDETSYVMYHSQDCCESVDVHSVTGDVATLIGKPITAVDEVIQSERPADEPKPQYEPESETWTTYTITAGETTVRIRWLGTSNGYYSESVTFCEASKQGVW